MPDHVVKVLADDLHGTRISVEQIQVLMEEVHKFVDRAIDTHRYGTIEDTMLGRHRNESLLKWLEP